MNATGMQFVYDAENHQTEARDAGGFVVGQYFYDGEGKRVKKISNTETTVFVYDGGGALVAEYSTAGNPTAAVKYLTQDHLGSPRIITDQNGAVVSRTDFGAFGDETMTPQRTSGLGYSAADGVRQDYTGYQKDDESGLEFAQARYYNPAHGRFTSPDPLTASASIRNPQTFNRYSYVLNSPYKFTDPLGLLSISTGACGQFCRGGLDGGGGFSPKSRDEENPDLLPAPEAHTNEAAEPAEATHEAVHATQQQADPMGPQQSDNFVKRTDDQESRETDSNLASIFTDTGVVLGASWVGNSISQHYQFGDQLHTIHIYGDDATASTSAGVYIPKQFSDLRITSNDTVVASNPNTGEVILIAHVQVGRNAKGSNINPTLAQNISQIRENGTIYIGQIGGQGGEGDSLRGRGVHSHLTYFRSESARLEATQLKRVEQRRSGSTGDYPASAARHLGNFRTLIR